MQYRGSFALAGCLLSLVQCASLAGALATGNVSSRSQVVSAAGRSFRVKIVEAPLGSVTVRVGLAQKRVGRTESLAAMAKRYGAVAAINGSFFDAYVSGPIKNPHHTLFTNGHLAHRGEVGRVLGFINGKEWGLDKLSLKIVGSLDGNEKWPDRWYAYWMNRYPGPSSTATVFTSDWANDVTPAGGTQIVVKEGVVTAINHSRNSIPRDGFVIYLKGSEESLARSFRVGRRCAYRIEQSPEGSEEFWGQVQEAIGGGPTLVRDGRVSVNPTSEGFSSPKILTMSAARSAAGVTANGKLLLVTCGAATVRQLAEIMRALGCVDALNLDGGASSSLWYRGKYLTSPGRELSNALLIVGNR